MININDFIFKHVIKREKSMFLNDLNANAIKLEKNIKGKSVMVIGGAGTIGSSFIKSLLPFQPKSLVVVDINENGLTELTRDLRSTKYLSMPEEYITYPMSYADKIFKKLFKSREGFNIVANFSAHKHVRSEKDIYSVEALIRNNVINAKSLLDLLEEYPPNKFFCVSTDKAANPVNIMGGSKKIMEDIIMAYSSKFNVTTARFANVAFSNGSLPEGFINRISKLQPISAPNDVTRYFVSPIESGQICLLACILGESGDIYFPQLKPEHVMTFSEIANLLLKEMGYEVEYCNSDSEAINKSLSIADQTNKYPVYYSGSNTTGEKSYEEFYTVDENTDMDRYEALGVITNVQPRPMIEIDKLLQNFEQSFKSDKVTKDDIVEIMKNFLVNFEHIEKGKTLDSKM